MDDVNATEPTGLDEERKHLSPAFTRYEHLLEKSHMTILEAEQLSADLARIVRHRELRFDVVVGIANGALLPMRIVAEELGLPEEIVRVRRQGSRIKQRLMAVKDALRIPSGWLTSGPLMPFWVWFQDRTSRLEGSAASASNTVSGMRVLLIDDCVETGNSLALVRQQLLSAGATEVKMAVICWATMPKMSVIVPDIYLHTTAHYYPWSGSSRYWGDFLDWLKVRGLALWQ